MKKRKIKSVSLKIKKKIFNNSRNSKAALTGVVSLAVKFISLSTGLLSIPITARYLGQEQFGLWILLSTLLNWITIADLGLVNSLVNVLAKALAEDKRNEAKQAVSSTFYPMLILGIAILFGSILFSPYIPWESLLNVHSAQLKIVARTSVTVCLCLFALKIPLSIPRCIYTSYQEGYIYQLWIGLVNILSLLFLLIAQHFHVNLPWLLGIFFGAVALGDLLAGIHIFCFKQKWLLPNIENYNFGTFKVLIKDGIQFWIAQICAICVFQTDLIIVSRLYSVSEVGVYGVLMKLFSIIETVSSTFITPLWPAYSEAYAKYEYKWIQKTFKISIISSVIWSICAGTLILNFSGLILQNWLGRSIIYPEKLPVFMFLTYTLLSVSQCIAVLVNALGRLKLQSFVAPLSALSNLFLSVMLGQTFGLQGVTSATSICIAIFSILVVGGDSLKTIKQLSKFKTSNNI